MAIPRQPRRSRVPVAGVAPSCARHGSVARRRAFNRFTLAPQLANVCQWVAGPPNRIVARTRLDLRPKLLKKCLKPRPKMPLGVT